MSILLWMMIMLKQTKIVFSTISCDPINDGIAACSGGFWVCEPAYHVCEAKEVAFFNLTRDQCANISPKNEIFLAREAAYGSKCGSYPNDNTTPANDDTTILRVWGCSSASSDEIETNSCGILNAAIDLDYLNTQPQMLSTLCCKNAPCEPSLIGYTPTELIPEDVYTCPIGQKCGGDYHICNAEEIALFGLNDNILANDQVCCRNGNAGCESKAGETELVPNAVYACRGTFNDIEEADLSVCGPFYHVCNSMNELQNLNLDGETCTNIGRNGKFYATLEGITTNTCSSSKDIDGIWGCGPSTNTISQCGILNSVISNGNFLDADGVLCCTDGEWTDTTWIDIPFMVQLRIPEFNCGGSILTLDGHSGKGAVLTAAHCIDDRTPSNLQIYIGCTTKTCENDNKSVYSVESLTYHSLWDPMSDIGGQYDIGIVYLTEAITHSNAISVVIESNPMAADDNGKAKLTGYSGGGGSRGGSDTDALEFAITNIMSRTECQQYNGSKYSSEKFGFTTLPTTLCLRSDEIAENGMVTICHGDSGSPIMHNGKQIGIVSHGHDTCDPFYPQVVAYVPSFYNWISSECGPECLNSEYLGCYKDDTYTPALTNEIQRKKDKRFSVNKCRNKCNGYQYFALQNEGSKCFCENDYELATRYGRSRECGAEKLGSILSNSLFVHSGLEQKKYLPDEVLKNGINLRYGPGKGQNNDVVYTVKSCRISCSQFKYFYVTESGECKCDNEIEYNKSYNDEEYDRHGLFKNVLIDGIETNDEYSDYVNLPLLSGESYPYDDWTKTQTVKLPNSANCGTVRIVCANAEKDDGPAGLMVGIKYKNQYISSNEETINGIITLSDTSDHSNTKIVLSSQTSTTPLSNSPYYAKWIWTCGENGDWNCAAGIENIFEIDLCELSVANTPNVIDFFTPRDKNAIYWILSIISVVINIVLVNICCCKSSKKYTKIKSVQFAQSDVENEEVV